VDDDQAAGARGLLTTALALADAGCSVVPARADGTKAPFASWKQYQDERASPDQIRTWLNVHRVDGIGVITGAVSGNLEMLELEGRAMTEGLLQTYARMLADHGLELLWKRVVAGYAELTPSGGLHILYRVDGAARGNTKLARRPAREDEYDRRGTRRARAPARQGVHPRADRDPRRRRLRRRRAVGRAHA
jgi:putative DNA primase/helicase